MYVPLFAFAEHKDVVTGCAFRSQGDTLLSTGKDSMLILRTFDYAIQPAAKANPVSKKCVPVSIHNRIRHLVAIGRDTYIISDMKHVVF